MDLETKQKLSPKSNKRSVEIQNDLQIKPLNKHQRVSSNQTAATQKSFLRQASQIPLFTDRTALNLKAPDLAFPKEDTIELDMFAQDFELVEDSKENSEHASTKNIHEDAVDKEGYYIMSYGEILNKKYKTTSTCVGKGVFGTVIKAINLETQEEVAIKLARNNDVMKRAGLKEIGFLEKLRRKDSKDQMHVVKFVESFMHKNHLCLVFESLSMNLREILKKYGKNVGISIDAVRLYTRQLLLSLLLMKRCGIVHCDIKPDNILINENRNVVKLCDFGSACNITEISLTPYMVSRYYRAPEIIMGCDYNYAVDIWSIGCTLYELYSGEILFPGKDNNEMLKLIMELKGSMPKKMIKKGQFSKDHFDNENYFLTKETNAEIKIEIPKRILINKPAKDLKTKLIDSETIESNKKLSASFIDFLEKCLILNPEKRLSIEDAFYHPFVKHQ